METLLPSIFQKVARKLGPGHSESIYQKAASLLLTDASILHHCEYHVPVTFSFQKSSASTTVATASPNITYNIGDERIDILAYDAHGNIHVIELKAVQNTLCPVNVRTGETTAATIAPPAHVQAMKYIRLLEIQQSSPTVKSAFVVNFRQSVRFQTQTLNVEIDYYDNILKKWNFAI